MDKYIYDENNALWYELQDEMFVRLVKEMEGREGVTEQLKTDKQMEWVGRMNNIRNCVTEIVNAKLIFA